MVTARPAETATSSPSRRGDDHGARGRVPAKLRPVLGAALVAAASGVCYALGLLAMTVSGDGDQPLAGGVLIGLGLSVALGLISAALHWPIAERPVPRLAEAGGAL